MSIVFCDVSPEWDDGTPEAAIAASTTGSQTPCALETADPERCRGWADPDAPVPLCRVHLAIAWQYCSETMAARPPTPQRILPLGEELVYFIRKDGLIKIGWTSNLKARMKYFRPDEILHTEPGSQRDEGALHRRFEHLRVCECVTGRGRHTREWFRPGEDLLAYVEERRRLAA